MPKQGGQGKGKPKLKDRNFGRALMKLQIQGAHGNSRKSKDGNLSSILENTGLDDFIATAEMEDQDFEVQHLNSQEQVLIGSKQPSSRLQQFSTESVHQHQLMIPRKPSWSYDMTAQEIDRNEKQVFLKWRRDIALIESTHNYDLKVTPFEKNLEVWRQLWRVCERSDIVIQVVDARNPLLYYTQDLNRYLTEMQPSRLMLLLINKADLLTEYQRKQWAQYFFRVGIKFFFYSAFQSQQDVDTNGVEPIPAAWEIQKQFGTFFSTIDMQQLKNLRNRKFDARGVNSDNCLEQDIVWGDSEIVETNKDTNSDILRTVGPINDNEEYLLGKDNDKGFDNSVNNHISCANSWKILTRSEFLGVLTYLSDIIRFQDNKDFAKDINNERKSCVGLVGFPNVGKSSVINTLLGVSRANHGKARVGVSSTPGKTKHFQTLILSDEILLCDCPGLVFPSVMSSAGEMLCAGILPINHMHDHFEPANIIASRVPMHLLNAYYGMNIERVFDVIDSHDRPPTGEEMLAAFCKVRGFITNGTGRWDDFRGCKEILRDFNDGHLLYVAIPPAVTDPSNGIVHIEQELVLKKWIFETESTMIQVDRVAKRLQQHQSNLITIPRSSQQPPNIVVNLDESSDSSNDNDEEAYDAILQAQDVLEEKPNMLQETSLSEEYEFISDEPFIPATEFSNVDPGKREHKKLKHWGKKNRKLRDKNPYGDNTQIKSFTVHTTNRNTTGLDLIRK